MKKYLLDLLWFGWQQALCCIFAAGIFAGLILTRYTTFGIPRYDLMLIMCLLLQAILIFSKIETKNELLVICLFHVIGLALEIFKVSVGSWSYADHGNIRIGNVPLYSGFMYAAIASYMCQSWRRLKLDVRNVPMKPTLALAALIYANFFTHHWLPDVRWFLVIAVIFVLRSSTIHFTVRGSKYKIPTTLSFFLIGFFVWIAENFSTFVGAWRYPNQRAGWSIVHTGKISSWSILVIFSFILVLWLKSYEHKITKAQTSSNL
jgi:uncharacterized membrane protein YoaT (DUF817 family)